MKQIRFFTLLCCVLLTLCGCSAKDAPAVSETYAGQNSVHCTLHYTVGMEAVIDGIDVGLMEQVYTADVQIDRASGAAHLLGDMVTYINSEALLTSSFESYSIPSDPDAHAFYRYDDMYCADAMENAYLSIVDAPLLFHLDTYTKSPQTEILYGSICRSYSGQEISGRESNLVMNGLTAQELSTEGCLMDVVLRVYEDTSLPAQLKINYSNLPDMNLSFSDGAGNSYKLTTLSYEVLYNNYGTAVSVDMPDGFRAAALNHQNGFAAPDLSVIAGNIASIEDAINATVNNYTGPFYGDYSNHYFILNRNRTHFYAIATPEFSQFEEQTQNRVEFSYFYSENDFELISYVFLDSTSDAMREANTATILAIYENDDAFTDVSHSELQSVTIGGYEVKYMAYYYTIELNGSPYDTAEFYSWAMAPSGTECIEVTITEYNGTGDGWLIDPIEELQYAYSAITGSGELN